MLWCSFADGGEPFLVGSVPVVVGPPNIEDFAPSPVSFLHIKELQDIETVAKKMKYLADNPGAYNESLRWGVNLGLLSEQWITLFNAHIISFYMAPLFYHVQSLPPVHRS